MWWGHGFNWGWMIFGGLMMLAFWGIFVALIVLAVRSVFGSARSISSTDSSTSGHNTALDILKERYARGEISKTEYEAIRDDLKT